MLSGWYIKLPVVVIALRKIICNFRSPIALLKRMGVLTITSVTNVIPIGWRLSQM